MQTNQYIPFSLSVSFTESGKKKSQILYWCQGMWSHIKSFADVQICFYQYSLSNVFGCMYKNISLHDSKVFVMYLPKRLIIDSWIVMQNVTGVSFSNLRGIILGISFCSDFQLNLWCIGMNETNRHSYTVLLKQKSQLTPWVCFIEYATYSISIGKKCKHWYIQISFSLF